MTPADQLHLPLPHRPGLGRGDFFVSAANEAAVKLVDEWRSWPNRRLAVTGPARCGKSHLARVWMAETGAVAVQAADMVPTDVDRLAGHGFVVVEDVDAGLGRAAEDALFHLYNLLGAEGGHLLVTGRGAPATWPIRTADLKSRLQSVIVAPISAPDDTLLSSVMVKLFADRQVHVAPEVVAYLVRRIERSFAAAEALVDKLDRLSLSRKRPVTRKMAAELLGSADDEEGTENAR